MWNPPAPHRPNKPPKKEQPPAQRTEEDDRHQRPAPSAVRSDSHALPPAPRPYHPPNHNEPVRAEAVTPPLVELHLLQHKDKEKEKTSEPKAAWYEFVAGCPAENCANSRKDIAWKHRPCGSSQLIGWNADLKCEECGVQDSIVNFTFRCEDHSDEFRKPDLVKLTWALQIALTTAHFKGDRAWAKRMQEELLRITQQQLVEELQQQQA